MRTYALSGASAIALLIAIGSGQTAFAQVDQVKPPAPAAEERQDRVVVTGSRIAVATGEEAPVPVTVVGTEELQVAAQSNIADALLEMPALRSSQTSSKGGHTTSGGSYLNLRGMSPFRTLVLLDGKRFVTSSTFGSGVGAVNVDAIPAGLVARVDTVTGGASAAYGSDAVAGVVNLVLDTQYEGLKGEAQIGQTDYGDVLNYKAQLTAGGSFADGRGHLLFNGEYARSDGLLGDFYGKNPARPWMDEFAIAATGGSAPPSLVPNGRFVGVPDRGVIWTGPLKGTAFNPDGTTRPYNFGTNIRGEAASGGDGWKMGSAQMLSTPNIRSAIFGRVSYELDDDTNIYFEAITAKSSTNGHIGSVETLTIAPAGMKIKRDNAYITPQLGALMDANNLTTIDIRKHTRPLAQAFENTTERIMLGMDGRINDDWTWDAYYTLGTNKGEIRWNYNANAAAFFYATDAVRDPNGNIVCRIKLTDPLNPCVPYNLMGTLMEESTQPGGLTPAQHKYLFPEVSFFSSNEQEVVEASVSGTLFELPAGTVGMAAGMGYRHESLERQTDTLGLSAQINPYSNTQGLLSFQNQPAIDGAYELWEGFVEFQVPLLADLPLIQSLDLNVASRYTEYSTSGGVNTWKAGLVYVPFEGLRIRGTLSRDIRAANIQELFSPPSTGYGTVTDPVLANTQYQMIPITLGNPNLVPEEADTKTLGLVYRPDFLPDFFVSVDWYNIEIAGQIAALGYQRIVNLCGATQSVAAYCNLVNRSAGSIVSVKQPLLNLSKFVTSGIDVEMGYEQPLDLFGMTGDLSLRMFGTYRDKFETTAAFAAPQDTAGAIGQEFGNLTATYKTGELALTLQQNYVSGGRIDYNFAAGRRFDGDRVKSQSFLDFTARYGFDGYEVFGTVQNVLDRDPPRYPYLIQLSTSNPVFDQLGRRYTVGIRFEM